jgi:hypothetical protein
MHKIQCSGAGWTIGVEYAVRTLDADGDAVDTREFTTEAEARSTAAILLAFDALMVGAVAVVIERVEYIVPTRAAARRIVADADAYAGDEHNLVLTVIARIGDEAAIDAGGWYDTQYQD